MYGLAKAVEVVEGCVAELESKGVTRDRIVVGGFSQGGAVALRTAYNNYSGNGGFAACVSLSGWVTFKDVSAESKAVPLFLGHGSQDDKVLFEQQNHAEMILTGGGVDNIESKSYRMGYFLNMKAAMTMSMKGMIKKFITWHTPTILHNSFLTSSVVQVDGDFHNKYIFAQRSPLTNELWM